MTATYRKLNDIIDNVYLDTMDEDSFISNTSRYHIIRFARQGLKELTAKFTSEVKKIRLDVSSSNTVILPHDYIRYLRVSEVTKSGKLIPISIDTSIMVGNTYLLDNLSRILLNDNGIPLLSSADYDINRTTEYSFDYSTCSGFGDYHYYNGAYTVGDYSNGGTSAFPHDYERHIQIDNVVASGVGFREDPNEGILQMQGRKLDSVVVEYMYNPAKSIHDLDKLEIEEVFSRTLEKYIYMELITRKRTVPNIEKEKARRDYREARMESKLTMSPTVDDVMRITKNR